MQGAVTVQIRAFPRGARPTQPPVISVVAEPQPARGGPGCLPLAVAGAVVVVALRLLGGA